MAMVEVFRFDILLIFLDPTLGSEIKKTRPCVVISPNEMNKHISTIIIAPMTSTLKNYPTRVEINFNGTKGNIVLDQIRTIDKLRVVKRLGKLDSQTSVQVTKILNEIFTA